MPKDLTPEQRARKRADYRKYYASNRERVLARNKAASVAGRWKVFYAKNRERRKAQTAMWRAKNPERARAKVAECTSRNRERYRAAKLEKYRTDENRRAYIKRKSQEWNSKNLEKVRKYKVDYTHRNYAAHMAKSAAWKAANPDKCLIHKHRRRSRENGCSGSHTAVEWRYVLEAHGNRCAWCGVKGTNKTPLARDHYVALSKGGTNDAKNLVPACKSCNSKKHARDPIDFAQSLGLLL